MPSSRLSSRRTVSHRAAHLPSCCTSWLSHCLSSPSRCAAPLVISLRQLVVASPLLVLSLCRPPVVLLHQLVLTSPLAVLSLRGPLVLSLHRLVVASCLDVPPTSPFIASPSHPLRAPADCHIASHRTTLSSSHRAGWLLHCLSLHYPLVLSLRRLVVELSFLLPPSRPLVMPPSHRAGWLLRCLHPTLPSPSNAIERHRHRRHCRCRCHC
jgi:hypothetical protein